MLILPSADGTGGTGTHPGTRLYWAWPPRWKDEAMRGERFRAQITANSRGHAVSTIPFDPDQAGGPKAVPQVSGTVHGCRGRVTIAPGDSGGACTRNPARMRQTGLAAGSAAFVERAPDGPPRAGLAGDSGAARAANRAAGACFGTLAQFYRGACLRYIDATTRRPDLRASRIAEVVGLLAAGVQERPRPGAR